MALLRTARKGDPMTQWPLFLSAFLACSAVFAGEERPVSFAADVVPILRGNCQGCHRPGKMKGGLDLTTHAAFAKGGKEDPGFVPGKPGDSRIIHEVSGEEPSMPKDAEPLTPEEISILTRWIAQGAADDSASPSVGPKLAGTPVYRQLPAISAMAWSPDGATLAVAGYHEVILHDATDGHITG